VFFKEFCYATLGERDEQGQYTHREKFYSFSSDFQHELDARMEERILEVAGDLFETDF